MSFAQVFFEECDAALGFLINERGWREVQRESTSVSAKVVYLKQEIALEVVLDWRDFDISAYVSLWDRARVAGVWQVDETERVVRELLQSVVGRSRFLSEEVQSLRLPSKLMKRAIETRDLDLCRQWFRSELSVLGKVLGNHEEEVLTSAQRYFASQLSRPPYTVAEVSVRLYTAPRNRPDDKTLRRRFSLPRGVSPPEFPTLPLEGLVIGTFRPATQTTGTGKAIGVQEPEMLWLELYLPSPLQQGGTARGWLAPLIAPQSGLVLEWWYAGGIIGEVLVKEPLEVLVSQFRAHLLDAPRRDLRAEFWEWARSVQRRKHQQ